MKTLLHRTLSLAAASILVSALSGTAAVVVSTIGAQSSAAASTPPWEPDPNSVGGLVFYNTLGAVITGGNLTDSPVAAYVEGTTAPRAGDTKASLFGFLPVDGQPTGQWSGEILGSSTAFPNGSAPSPLDDLTLPLETGHGGDETIAELESDYPNLDTTDDGYAYMYQLRLYTSASGEGVSRTYDSADIEVTDSSWSVIYTASPQVTTTTTLSVSPQASAYHGANVTLTATVTPSDAVGSIRFRNGSSVIATEPVSSGTARDVTSTLANATYHLSATFVPTTPTDFTTSTSSSETLLVKAHPTTTTLKSSTHVANAGQTVTLTATESPSVTGTVTFYDGAKVLGGVKVVRGVAKYATKKLTVGVDSLKAKFTPSSSANDSASTSTVVKVTIKK
jgi:hypothetical protein